MKCLKKSEGRGRKGSRTWPECCGTSQESQLNKTWELTLGLANVLVHHSCLCFVVVCSSFLFQQPPRLSVIKHPQQRRKDEKKRSRQVFVSVQSWMKRCFFIVIESRDALLCLRGCSRFHLCSHFSAGNKIFEGKRSNSGQPLKDCGQGCRKFFRSTLSWSSNTQATILISGL